MIGNRIKGNWENYLYCWNSGVIHLVNDITVRHSLYFSYKSNNTISLSFIPTLQELKNQWQNTTLSCYCTVSMQTCHTICGDLQSSCAQFVSSGSARGEAFAIICFKNCAYYFNVFISYWKAVTGLHYCYKWTFPVEIHGRHNLLHRE